MNEKRHVIFLHGFASSGRGTKSQYFRRRIAEESSGIDFHAVEFQPTPADFEFMTVTGMINRLRQFVLDNGIGQVTLIGSSMGGLVAANYAQRFGNVDWLLLLAPALIYRPWSLSETESEEWRRQGVIEVDHYAFGRSLPIRYDLALDGARYDQPPPPICPVTIVHGSHDEVVPASMSRAYAGAYPELVSLIEFDAGHDLNGALDRIWEIWTQGSVGAR